MSIKIKRPVINLLDKLYEAITKPEIVGGWKDNVVGFNGAKGNGTTEPVWGSSGASGIYAMEFTVGDELFLYYHVLHDYKLKSNVYPHLHFFVDETMTAGQQVTWQLKYVEALGYVQGDSLSTPVGDTITLTYTATGNEVAGEHIILECSDVQAFPHKDIDAILMMSIELISENVSGSIFGVMCDIHYESDGSITKQRNGLLGEWVKNIWGRL